MTVLPQEKRSTTSLAWIVGTVLSIAVALFSYRYAMILLPWMFLLLVGNGPRRVSATEAVLFAVSIAINAMAVYEFLWTENIRP